MLHTRERIDRLYERRLDTSDTALQRTPRRIIHPADMVMDVLSGAQLSPLTRSLIVMRLCALIALTRARHATCTMQAFPARLHAHATSHMLCHMRSRMP